MKFSAAKAFFRSRYPLAIAAGFLLACAFPKIGIAGLGWIAPGLMLGVALGTSGKQSFRIGYVAGLAHYLTSLYWLLLIPVKGFPILGWVALSAFLALYPAVWVWMAVKASGARYQAPGEAMSRSNLIEALSSPSWGQRTAWALGCAAIWVALEMIVARFLGGFPWNLLGASQYRLVPLIQIASFTGVYGVSFLLVWSSLSLLNAVIAIIKRPQMRSAWVGEIALPMLAIGTAFGFGFHQLRQTAPAGRELKVTMVQPSIPQTLIWNQSGNMERFQQLISLSEQALTNETDVLIWPEAAIPGLLRYDKDVREPILNFARAHKVWMIVGADDAEPRKGSTDPNDAEYYNASFLISPEGKIMERYIKRSLVIFGEYIPFERSLPFIKWLTPITGSFTPGDKAVPFEFRLPERQPPARQDVIELNRAGSEADAPSETDDLVKTSVLICFEDNFPHLVRDYAEDDTDFLVNITNDGWFRESAAQWQHAANAIFRTIENGLPLIRCSNNGLTCWVDAQGRIRQMFTDKSGTIYGTGFMTTRIPLPGAGERRAPTFYQRHGDWFGWSCVCLFALTLAKHLLAGRNQARNR